MPQPEAPSRRLLLIGTVSAVAALVIAAMIWLIGNPMSTGPAVEPPEPPAPAVAASAEALPPPADMPVPALVPPPVAESFSIVVGTYDSLREAQRAESALREQNLIPYTIDVLIAPDDLRRRLLLGRFATRDEAEAARAKLGSLSENARVIIGWSERFRVPVPD